MLKPLQVTFTIAAALLTFLPASLNGQQEVYYQTLKSKYDLGGERIQKTQYFMMETKVIEYSPGGERINTDIYRMMLKCDPLSRGNLSASRYTCGNFGLEQGDKSAVYIPALKNWTYTVEDGLDEDGQVFGIDHSRFEGLSDSEGANLPPGTAYMVYNTFIDFHSFCDVFAQPSDEGPGIQDLDRIGRKIVHSAAYSRPPVNLGGIIAEGSYFENGRITLEFKGISLVSGRPAAIVGYDSGESSYRMLMEPVPEPGGAAAALVAAAILTRRHRRRP
jgi:hypothetical protein